jgi:multiple sugar transport system permease protein
MKRWLYTILPHMVLTAFSLVILLPLLWIVRVSLTDKLTAYRIPPEIGTLGLMNYVDIFARYPFVTWFSNSLLVALLATAISLPIATAMAYAFARFNTGGSLLRLGVLASQMLPPIILVLPLFGMFLVAHLTQSRTGIVIAHLTIALPFLAWMLVSFFEGDVARLEEAARVDGATRWQAFRYIAVPVAAPGILAAGNSRRRRDCAARGSDRGVAAPGVHPAAVPAQASDQGVVAWGPQVTAISTVGR